MPYHIITREPYSDDRALIIAQPDVSSTARLDAGKVFVKFGEARPWAQFSRIDKPIPIPGHSTDRNAYELREVAYLKPSLDSRPPLDVLSLILGAAEQRAESLNVAALVVDSLGDGPLSILLTYNGYRRMDGYFGDNLYVRNFDLPQTR